jgi:hypothetical protein
MENGDMERGDDKWRKERKSTEKKTEQERECIQMW